MTTIEGNIFDFIRNKNISNTIIINIINNNITNLKNDLNRDKQEKLIYAILLLPYRFKVLVYLLKNKFYYKNNDLLRLIIDNYSQKNIIYLIKHFNLELSDLNVKTIVDYSYIDIINYVFKKEGFTKRILTAYDKFYTELDLKDFKIRKVLFELDLKEYPRLELIVKAKKNDYKKKIDVLLKDTPYYLDLAKIIYEYQQ
jgi:hypothetical protein